MPLPPVPTVCPLTSLSNDFTSSDVNANDISESVLFPQTSQSRNAPLVSVPNMIYHIYFKGMKEQIKVPHQKWRCHKRDDGSKVSSISEEVRIFICLDVILLIFLGSTYLRDLVLSFLLHRCSWLALKEVAWLPFCTGSDEGLDGWKALACCCFFYDSVALINERLFILCPSECLRPPPFH